MTAIQELAIGHCYGCATVFVFDPETVASVLLDPDGQPISDGQRIAAGEPRPGTWVSQAVCDPCADRAEAVAKTLGLFPLWPVRQAQQVGGPLQ